MTSPPQEAFYRSCSSTTAMGPHTHCQQSTPVGELKRHTTERFDWCGRTKARYKDAEKIGGIAGLLQQAKDAFILVNVFSYISTFGPYLFPQV